MQFSTKRISGSLIHMKLPDKYILSKILRQSNNKLDFCEYCDDIVTIYG